MRYIQYQPSLNGNSVTGLGFNTEAECDAYCLEMNQVMVANYEERGLPCPLHRYKALQVIQWLLLITEGVSIILFIVFLHKWTHGHYESALCALAARVMLFGLPVVSITPVR